MTQRTDLRLTFALDSDEGGEKRWEVVGGGVGGWGRSMCTYIGSLEREREGSVGRMDRWNGGVGREGMKDREIWSD